MEYIQERLYKRFMFSQKSPFLTSFAMQWYWNKNTSDCQTLIACDKHMVFLFIFTSLHYRFDVKTNFFYNQPVKVKNNIIIVTTTCDVYRGPS